MTATGKLIASLCFLQLDADGRPDGERVPFVLHFVFLLEHTVPADFAEAVSRSRWLDVELDDHRLTVALDRAYWSG
ncbi:hypothetical protein [Streptomyces sp. NPDC001139]